MIWRGLNVGLFVEVLTMGLAPYGIFWCMCVCVTISTLNICFLHFDVAWDQKTIYQTFWCGLGPNDYLSYGKPTRNHVYSALSHFITCPTSVSASSKAKEKSLNDPPNSWCCQRPMSWTPSIHHVSWLNEAFLKWGGSPKSWKFWIFRVKIHI